MKTIRQWGLALLVAGSLIGCAKAPPKSADVVAPIRSSLDQAGFADVSVDQDREKGIVTLRGHVATESDKEQAEALARSIAGTQVVSNQIDVVPKGAEDEAHDVNSELDKAIEHNLDAAFTAEHLHDDVHFSVAKQVVTLTGSVHTQDLRTHAADVAMGVPYVRQVVNELQVEDQPASERK